MRGLYKGKYIIAIYDKNGLLIDVGCCPNEISVIKNKRSLYSFLCHIEAGSIQTNRIRLIDCTKKRNDIFASEDKLFIKFIKSNYKQITNRELAQKQCMNERTFYRYISQNKESYDNKRFNEQ